MDDGSDVLGLIFDGKFLQEVNLTADAMEFFANYFSIICVSSFL